MAARAKAVVDLWQGILDGGRGRHRGNSAAFGRQLGARPAPRRRRAGAGR
jgi:hypothetical protein